MDGFVDDIERRTEENSDFRRVLYISRETGDRHRV